MSRLTRGDKQLIRMILGRVHVGTDYLGHVRAVIASVPKRRKQFLTLTPRPIRRAALKFIAQVRNEQRALYRKVMSGRI